MALSSVLECRIYSVYQNCNLGIRALLSGIILPVGKCNSSITLQILWSRDSSLDTTPSLPYEPNHFVPVLRTNNHKSKYEAGDESQQNKRSKIPSFPSESGETSDKTQSDSKIPIFPL